MDKTIVAIKSKLSEQQLMVLQSEVNKHRKSTGTAYLFLIFLSWTGAHQFYLRNKFKGFVYVLSSFAPLYMLVSMFVLGSRGGTQKSLVHTATGIVATCIVLMICACFMWFYDLFTLSGQTERANNKIEAVTMAVLQSESKSA